jgi:hypothetical protein
MPSVYGFPAWVEEHLGRGASPRAVQRYFASRDIHLSVEKWRLLMKGPPLRPDLRLWCGISDATGERLSRFIDHKPHPDGVQEPVRFGRRESNHEVEKAAEELAFPDPRRYFGVASDV